MKLNRIIPYLATIITYNLTVTTNGGYIWKINYFDAIIFTGSGGGLTAFFIFGLYLSFYLWLEMFIFKAFNL